MDFLRLHQTSSKCNLNIQNIILNWYGKIVKSKKYEKFQNAGGGGRWGRSQLGLVVGVENPDNLIHQLQKEEEQSDTFKPCLDHSGPGFHIKCNLDSLCLHSKYIEYVVLLHMINRVSAVTLHF